MSRRIGFEAFGVALVVEVSGDRHARDLDALSDAVWSVLPPGAVGSGHAGIGPDAELKLTACRNGFTVSGVDGGTHRSTREVDALHALDREIRAVVSLLAPGLVFVHAGVVAVAAGAVVIPGRSFTGKTTLVARLVADGATYLSDEYAVLDGTGAVWPYPRPLSLRTPHGRSDVPPAAIGTVAADRAVRVAAVVTAPYRDGARWAPSHGSPAGGALALLDNAVAATVRPRDVLAAVAKAARTARYFTGERGEAGFASHHILAAVGSSAPATCTPR